MTWPAFRRALAAVAVLPLLAACENSATAYMIEGSQHALILVREQPYFWTGTVNQAVIASRLPQCQRRVAIHPDRTELTDIEVYEAGERLWALHQGERWYLVGTSQCQVQDWDNPAGSAPGPLAGTFRLKDGSAAFVPAAK
jgi:hypothetical protein